MRKNLPPAVLVFSLALLAAGPALSAEETPPPGGEQAPAYDDPETLAALAVETHPSLEAMQSRTESLRAAAGTARLWSDPMFGAELSNLPVTSPILGAHAMSGLQFKLQQRFPGPGELKARAATAERRITAAKRDVDAAANALRGEVRGRYYDLALLRQLEAVTAEHVAELNDLIDAVDARYRVGGASQHDLLQLALRRDRLAQTLLDFPARQEQVLAALNGALARDPATPIRTPGQTPLAPLPGDAGQRAGELPAHPDIVRLEATAEVARAEAEQARVEANPEPTVWLGYRVRAAVPNADPGVNFVTAGVSMPLPFASTRRWRALASVAEAKARAADAAAEGVQTRLAAALASAEAAHARAVERAVAYRDVLHPAADAALQSTLSAYQVDRAAFADLVRAEVELLDVRREALRAEAAAAVARATIVTLLAEAGERRGVAE
ncbi:MAG: TolC family protein [Deltaproteobacteria bacterium]|nr:TolC family protein [Deltaproteobacteria bacterium]